MRKKLKYLSIESARMALEAWEERVKPDSLICIIQWRSVQEVTKLEQTWISSRAVLERIGVSGAENMDFKIQGWWQSSMIFPHRFVGMHDRVLLVHQPPHPSAERAFLSLTEPWGSLMLPEHLLPSVCAHTGCQGPQCQNKCLACSSVTTALPSHSWLK